MASSAPVKPRNAAATRLAILAAARERFVRDGYDQAGLRAIAADAGVDPALICRYFGSKESLFAEVLDSTSEDPMEVLAGDRAGFGARVARALLDPKQHCPARIAFLQLAARSSGSPAASRLMRRHIESQFIAPFSNWLEHRTVCPTESDRRDASSARREEGAGRAPATDEQRRAATQIGDLTTEGKPSAALGQKRAAEKAWLTACVLVGVGVMASLEQAQATTPETAAAIERLGSLLQSIIED